MEGRQYYAPRENVDGNRTAMGGPHSPWHSPVPYLFGGLAAMLGLIAFALLILACSYWRLSGYLDGEENQSRERDLEAGDAKPEKEVKAVAFPEKFLVIMAGDVNPTYLATPVEKSCTCDNDEDEDGDDVEGNDQVVRQISESNGATH
ncbi:protein GLUTAMINE DUMPER 3-like [Brassica rapa]|uniref:Protein GLUTAMINE DUMPER 3 n=1 Tax=Brassica campestris TaxID=3711 RepID=M4CES5_BRACM|nr:protein GLUTAMINE DUMPER 3-like [Brassica rapa]